MELGLGYITLSDKRLSQVDFLSWMGELEFVMVTARPKEVQSYMTLIRPLDLYTWCFLAGSSLLMVMVLLCVYWMASSENLIHRGLPTNGMGNDLFVDFPAGCWLWGYTQPLQRFSSHLVIFKTYLKGYQKNELSVKRSFPFCCVAKIHTVAESFSRPFSEPGENSYDGLCHSHRN